MSTITKRSVKRWAMKNLGKKEEKKEQVHEFYTSSTGQERVRIYHPTKGWRDRNINTLA